MAEVVGLDRLQGSEVSNAHLLPSGTTAGGGNRLWWISYPIVHSMSSASVAGLSVTSPDLSISL